MNNITLNLLCLQIAFGVGTKKAYDVYSHLKNQSLLNKPFTQFNKKDFIDESDFNSMKSIDKSYLNKIVNDCKNDDITILTIEDDNYPCLLRNISVPPLVLYIKGEMILDDNTPAVCIVGPRKCSEFGKRAAYSLAMRLSMAGMVVVSGAALGCDSFAHRGALDSECKTVALLGCGINYDYLPQNRILRSKIMQNGCLISEYPPDAPTTKYSFLVRNRLMSGLSVATVIIEAPEKSGAINTANHAIEQGKDVFVIPGNPTFEQYKGSNKLLQDGANVLTSARDILEIYASQYPDVINIEKAYKKSGQTNDFNKKIRKKSTSGLSNEAKIVYNCLDKQKFFVDELLKLNIPDASLLSALTELEIEGFIKAVAGGAFELV